jgi:hypothetical protein
MTVSGFHNEQNTSADTSATATYNSDTSSWDCTLSAKYKTVATSFGASKAIKLTGVGIDGIPAGRHR